MFLKVHEALPETVGLYLLLPDGADWHTFTELRGRNHWQNNCFLEFVNQSCLSCLSNEAAVNSMYVDQPDQASRRRLHWGTLTKAFCQLCVAIGRSYASDAAAMLLAEAD